ncbi:13659_t:CDS:2 [Dentiscutata heterogama]|uniref:13659_t:CDS:1 n=1 Tax=Dentiscutata heterogama TaxID=1316150 RepID=A0ACA9L294_9GLOM|nr:13659_t:CDS:2 [Dentiscutata heterogama]
MTHNESTSNFKDLSNLEFGESTHGLESDEPIYDLEFNRPTYDSVVVVQENKDVELDCSKEKLYKGMVFKSWEEAFDMLELYSQYEGFKLRKGRVEKTSNGTIRKRTMLLKEDSRQINKLEEVVAVVPKKSKRQDKDHSENKGKRAKLNHDSVAKALKMHKEVVVEKQD